MPAGIATDGAGDTVADVVSEAIVRTLKMSPLGTKYPLPRNKLLLEHRANARHHACCRAHRARHWCHIGNRFGFAIQCRETSGNRSLPGSVRNQVQPFKMVGIVARKRDVGVCRRVVASTLVGL